MRIIAHRGYWLIPEEKNTLTAFQRCIDRGFGIETDVRDYRGSLVISHDVPTDSNELLSFDDFLSLYKQNKDEQALLAINIKSDGIHILLQDAIKRHNLQSYFVFDMSFPGMFFSYKPTGVNFYSSINEYIQKPALINEASGIWMDAYHDIWYTTEQIKHYIDKGKHVCITSPELHGRDYMQLWNDIKSSGIGDSEYLSLCTDFPDKAHSYFN